MLLRGTLSSVPPTSPCHSPLVSRLQVVFSRGTRLSALEKSTKATFFSPFRRVCQESIGDMLQASSPLLRTSLPLIMFKPVAKTFA